jgi:hypothetical protein|tara:strand:- start:280 stop:552 length:273 start_codon:yes stop_codon:yes gene_type:complete
METFTKQPTELLDYDIDLSLWLKTGDSVISTSVTSAPVGLSIALTDVATSIPKVWISDGVDKVTYIITAIVATNQGRRKEVNFKLKLKDV